MVDGTCVESMALEVARQHKLPPGILRRASLLYQVRFCLTTRAAAYDGPLLCWQCGAAKHGLAIARALRMIVWRPWYGSMQSLSDGFPSVRAGSWCDARG